MYVTLYRLYTPCAESATRRSMDCGGDLSGGQEHDVPAGEEGFEIFLGVGDEACGSIVTVFGHRGVV